MNATNMNRLIPTILAFLLVTGTITPFAYSAEHAPPAVDHSGAAASAKRLDLKQGHSAALATPPTGAPTSSTLFHDVPSINGRYAVGRTTLTPYIGAGFGGGFGSDRERALSPGGQTQLDSGLRSQWSQFGQGLGPNEFQMGIRIPF